MTTQGQDFVAVDLAEIAREVVSDLEVQIEQAGGRVEVGHLPTIQADPLQMRQLLQNLIGNGLKFHRVDDPPVVKVQGRFVHGREHRKPGVSAAQEQCRIVVEDNGIGFEQRHQDRIFGVFQRLHPRDVSRAWASAWLCAARSSSATAARSPPAAIPAEGSVFEVLLPDVHTTPKQ